MRPDEEDRRRPAGETAIQEQAGQPLQQIVTDARATERSRRFERWARANFETPAVERSDQVSVDWDQFAMSWPERRAAGIALLERERAA